jgi:hypothetical protein
MKKSPLLALLLMIAGLIHGRQGTPLDPVASLLFKNVITKLSVAEKNAIAAKTGFFLSGVKGRPFALDKESGDYPFAAVVMPTDMNKDGQEEIFISFGNTYTSGLTGSSIALFIKGADGVYADQLGFPGTIPDALGETCLGYPDLLIGGPGFEYPVWRWDGKAYGYSRTVKDADYGKLIKRSVDELSQAYQRTIKDQMR